MRGRAVSGLLIAALLAGCSGGRRDVSEQPPASEPDAPSTTGTPLPTTVDRSSGSSEATTDDGGGVVGDRAASLVSTAVISMPETVEGLRAIEHDGAVWIAALFLERLMVGRADQPMSAWIRIGQPPFGAVEMASTTDGLVVVVGDQNDSASVWLIGDGTAVRHQESFDGAFLPTGLTEIDGQWWLSGLTDLDTSDDGVVAFGPSIFVSDDAVVWSDLGASFDVGLNADELLNRAVRSVVELPDRLLAVLTAPQGAGGPAIVVQSVDGGMTWTTSPFVGPVPTSLVESGGSIFGFAAYSDGASAPIPVVRLDPSGGWQPVEAVVRTGPEPIVAGPSVGPGPLVGLFTVGGPSDCWYPLGQTTCGSSFWFASGFETDTVSRIEISDPDRTYPPLVVVSTSDGKIVTVRSVRGVELSVEVHDADLVEQAAPVLDPNGALMIDLGTTYRFHVGTHCGIDHLARINGVDWYLDGPFSGAFPPGTDERQRFWADITLVANDVIELDADGYLEARYVPGPDLEAGCE